MARPNTAGLPHLNCRSDAGQFTYHRSFRPDLVPFLAGVLRSSWSRRSVALDGREVIKVSLGTGDRRLAVTRWEELHPLVQAAVRDAERRQAAARSAERDRIAPERLAPEAVRTMAAQVLHTALAEHDRTYTEPGHLNGTARAIDRVVAAGDGSRLGPVEVREAERGFRERLYRDALTERRLDTLDLAVIEGEVDLPQELAERLRRDPSSLTAADRLVIARATLIAPAVIPSELDALLVANGLALPPDHPDRGALALAVARAQVRAAKLERAREMRSPEIDTPPMPSPVRAAAPVEGAPEADPERRLSALLERWKRDKRPSAKQADDKALYMRLFIGRHGDLPAERVTPLMVSQFRDALLQVANNATAALHDASLDALVAWSLKPENLGRKRLSRSTINAKALGALSVVMKAAKALGFIQNNPCSDQSLEIRPGDAIKRKAYSPADLKSIFLCGVFSNEPQLTKGGGGPAALWLPLLALFTGARLEELGQLLVDDVRCGDGVHHFVVTDLPDGEDPIYVGPDKSVKTAAGRRRIPIHSELQRLGFLAFVARRRAAGCVRLFPELDYYRGRCTKNWSRYWARLTDRHVTDRDDKAFHSFRHTFTRKLRHAKVAETTIKALVGHADDGDVTSGYGGDDEGFLLELGILAEAVETIAFPDLDLSRLIGLSERCGW